MKDPAMLRIGKLTDYATVLMSCLASRAITLMAASELAALARLELPTARKLLKQLATAGLIQSQRGSRGGYQLCRPATDISVLDIVVALEGPLGMTECSAHAGACGREPHCQVQHNWQRVSAVIAAALQEIKLADMLPAPPPPRRQSKPRPFPVAVVLRT